MTDGGLDLRGAFRAVVEALAEVGVPHAFIGALPVLAWGRVRATTDIDLVVLVGTAWPRIEAALRRQGFEPTRRVGPADVADRLPDIVVFEAPGGRSAPSAGQSSARVRSPSRIGIASAPLSKR